MNRALLLAAACAAVLYALFFARPHATPGPAMRDFEAYYAAGATWNAGADPYGTAVWNAERRIDGVRADRYEFLPFVGPPAALPIFGLVARMPYPVATIVWRGVLALSALALALAALRLAGLALNAWRIAAVAVAALGFGPLTSAVALGQIALPACAAAVCAALLLRRSPAWSAIVSSFGWLQPNVALALLSQSTSKRALPGIAGGIALFAGISLAVSGAHGAFDYANVLRAHGAAERFSAIQLTPAAVAYGLGANGQAAAATGAIVAVAAIAVWFWLMRLPSSPAMRFAVTCALLPLAVPFFHEHDLVIVFAAAIVFTARGSERAWPFALAGSLFCATDWLGLAQRPDGTLQTLLLVGAAGTGLALLRGAARARSISIVFGVLASIAVASAVAHAHPAPIWPDAMGALPPDVRASGAAAAWHAEQAATGLFARNAAWALLRSLSLAGCALLVYAGALSCRSTADSRRSSTVPAAAR